MALMSFRFKDLYPTTHGVFILIVNHFDRNYIYILCHFPDSQQGGGTCKFYKRSYLYISKYMKRIRFVFASNVPSINQGGRKGKTLRTVKYTEQQ